MPIINIRAHKYEILKCSESFIIFSYKIVEDSELNKSVTLHRLSVRRCICYTVQTCTPPKMYTVGTNFSKRKQ